MSLGVVWLWGRPARPDVSFTYCPSLSQRDRTSIFFFEKTFQIVIDTTTDLFHYVSRLFGTRTSFPAFWSRLPSCNLNVAGDGFILFKGCNRRFNEGRFTLTLPTFRDSCFSCIIYKESRMMLYDMLHHIRVIYLCPMLSTLDVEHLRI